MRNRDPATRMPSAEARPIFWSFRRCPYAMRARLAIASAGVEVELREILLRDKPAAFRAASPKATVPVLALPDGEIIEESRDIMLWALGRRDPDGWLDVYNQDRQAGDAFFAMLDGPFKTHLDRYKYASRFDPDQGAMHRDKGAVTLIKFDAILQSQPALSGEILGLFDFAALPFVRQFRIADPTWFDAQSWPALHAWLQAFLASDQFADIMTKYSPWQDGDTGLAFP
ncbi:glutathione S-transferase N-terminal domain-containing protein [Alphaproteobacteria bacterium]|jgi:glutathione S-transferase|nr:glutathione S-transferase N-terminal domain-containing protein [Alphaproteobacteria bacterium]